MKTLKVIIASLLVAFAVSTMAQAEAKPLNKKDDTRAKVEVVQGKNALVLKTGRRTQSSNYTGSNPADIVLELNDNTWRMFDSLVAAPWGASVTVKDMSGYNVLVQKANVDDKVGLMFTSGSKYVVLKKDEFEVLRK